MAVSSARAAGLVAVAALGAALVMADARVDAIAGGFPAGAVDPIGGGSGAGVDTIGEGTAAGFVDATAEAGIDFRHVNGAFGEKWMPESLGSGVAAFDADADGWTDLLFVQGKAWPGHEEALPEGVEEPTMRLYRNRRDGTFEDATEGSGLEVPMYGFGAAPADFDGDGRVDLYVTAYGPNRLFRNVGEGRFVDVTDTAGVGHPGWGTSAAWLDYDRDGDLDLYLANYVEWSPETDIWCTLDGTAKAYCTPESYTGEPSVLYRNEGDGRFVDVTREAGVFAAGGKSLGVALADFNDDAWPDLVVANDTEPNFLFENRRDGTFDERGIVSGMAFDSNGRARAGMGIDVADVRNTGAAALAIGNFSNEMIGLFELLDGGVFTDVAPRTELGRGSLLYLTFALFFFDYDLDGWLDLLAVNGHLEDRINEVQPAVTYAQRPLLYRNDPEAGFVDVGGEIGGPLARPIVGRGGAYLDYDRDGDIDVVVTTNDGPAYLWRNTARDADPAPGVLRLRLRGAAATGNRQAIGAVATVRSGEWRQRQVVRSGSSYASQSELTLTFGLDRRASVDGVEISWPDGSASALSDADLEGAVDHELVVEQGRGLVEWLPLKRIAATDSR